MAHVRVSRELIERTGHAVNSMRNAALAALGDEPNSEEIKEELFKLAEDHAYADAPHLKGQLPSSWMEDLHMVQVDILEVDAEGRRHRLGGEYIYHDFNGSKQVPGTLKWGVRPVAVKVDKEDLEPAMWSWVERWANHKAEVLEIVEKYRAVERQLKAFLETHNSLNKAMKEMPALEMYLPQKYLDKLYASTKKREKKPADEPQAVEVDTDMLTSVGVAHRLTSSGNE